MPAIMEANQCLPHTNTVDALSSSSSQLSQAAVPVVRGKSGPHWLVSVLVVDLMTPLKSTPYKQQCARLLTS